MKIATIIVSSISGAVFLFLFLLNPQFLWLVAIFASLSAAFSWGAKWQSVITTIIFGGLSFFFLIASLSTSGVIYKLAIVVPTGTLLIMFVYMLLFTITYDFKKENGRYVCEDCGAEVKKEDTFCPKCGRKFD